MPVAIALMIPPYRGGTVLSQSVPHRDEIQTKLEELFVQHAVSAAILWRPRSMKRGTSTATTDGLTQEALRNILLTTPSLTL